MKRMEDNRGNKDTRAAQPFTYTGERTPGLTALRSSSFLSFPTKAPTKRTGQGRQSRDKKHLHRQQTPTKPTHPALQIKSTSHIGRRQHVRQYPQILHHLLLPSLFPPRPPASSAAATAASLPPPRGGADAEAVGASGGREPSDVNVQGRLAPISVGDCLAPLLEIDKSAGRDRGWGRRGSERRRGARVGSRA